MPALSEEVQTFIVQAHACFRKPALIVRDVKAEFGLPLSREQVLFYHPERGGKSKRIAEKWRHIFAETRAAFLKGKVRVGIAHQSYRLSLLQRAADYYEEKGNYVLAAEMAERAAREVGGAYTNRRRVTVEGLEAARRALAVMLDDFAPQIETGVLQTSQIIEMVAADHDVSPDDLKLASQAVN